MQNNKINTQRTNKKIERTKHQRIVIYIIPENKRYATNKKICKENIQRTKH